MLQAPEALKVRRLLSQLVSAADNALHTMGDRAVSDEIDAYTGSADSADAGGKYSGQL